MQVSGLLKNRMADTPFDDDYSWDGMVPGGFVISQMDARYANIPRYLNSCGVGGNPNVRLEWDCKKSMLFVRANRVIRKGEELLAV